MTKKKDRSGYVKAAYMFIAAFLLLLVSVVSLRVSADRDVTTITLKINYYYYDTNAPGNKGYSPYPSFIANMPVGSNPVTEKCPSIPGFSARDESGNNCESVTLYFDSAELDGHEVNVFYYPSDVSYAIRLMKQRLGSNDYDLANVIHSQGATGSEPVEFNSSYRFPDHYQIEALRGHSLDDVYTGFTLMYHQPEVIAADGSTVFECYYDRDYYQISFELGEGGSGVSPIYAPYESDLVFHNPTRAGFRFKGWAYKNDDESHIYTTDEVISEENLPKKITQDETFVAVWEQLEPINYHIVYRKADLSDGSGETTYSYWGSRSLTIQPGDSQNLSLDDIIDTYKDDYQNVDDLNENTGLYELEDFPYFSFDEDVTRSLNSSSIEVNGDGSTVVTLYYARREYELKFVYARASAPTQEYVSETTIVPYKEDSPADPYKTYYIILNKGTSEKAMTSENDSYNNAHGLKLSALSGTDVKWKFTAVKDDQGNYKDNVYYVSCEADGSTKYLHIDFKTDGNPPALGDNQNTYLSDDPQEINVYLKNGVWVFKNNAHNWYLNNKSNQDKIASTYYDDSVTWKLYEKKEKQTTYGSIQITNSTRNGIDPGKPSNNWWGVIINELPEVTIPDDPRISLKTETKVFSNVTYVYYYISLKAEYGADIGSVWPVSPAGDVYRIGDNAVYKFGSWGTQNGSLYRQNHSGDNRSNIIGPYPTMSKEMTMIGHEDEENGMTLYAWWGDYTANITPHRYDIYLETIEDGPGGVTQYELFDPGDDRYNFQCAHNNNTYTYPFMFKGYEVLPADSGNILSKKYKDSNGNYYTPFHYKRKRSTLTFRNYNTDIKTVSSVKYETPLSGHIPEGTPQIPDGLDPEHYTFEGWYTSDLFHPSERVYPEDVTDEHGTVIHKATTMPDSNLIVYAYWKPKTYTVRYYNDESDYQNNNQFVEKSDHDYGQYIPSSEHTEVGSLLDPPEYTLSDGSQAQATPVGWYYYDSEGVLHAFNPDTMAVSGNIDLFMRWSTTVPANFRVHYYLEGTSQKLASDTTGYSFVGLTRTFKAKVDKELDPDYRSNYFPFFSSTSILMKGNEAENERTFYYAHRDRVPYEVRYIKLNDDGTPGSSLHPPKQVLNNNKTIVTEKYLPIANYVPNSYYISRIVTISDDDVEDQIAERNIITFYYTYDDKNIPYHIKYMLEDEETGSEDLQIGDTTYTFKQANYIDGIGDRNTSITASVTEYPGYEYVGYGEIDYHGVIGETEEMAHTGFNVHDPSQPIPEAISIGLFENYGDTQISKEIHLHYIKKSYPVKVTYSVFTENNDKIKEWYDNITSLGLGLTPDTSTAVTIGSDTVYTTLYKMLPAEKFGSTVEQTAPVLTDFRFLGNEKQTLVVTDDTSDLTKNKINFVYTELEQVMFYYDAVMPEKNGPDTYIPPGDDPKLLNLNQESIAVGERPTRQIVAKTNQPGYQFIGWFTDRACTQPVPASYLVNGESNILLPQNGANSDQHFYARYDYLRGDLTLTTRGCLTDSVNSEQSFIYLIKGKDAGYNDWISMKVVVRGNDSLTIKDLPIGNYDVKETDWSWRYDNDKTDSKEAVVISENNTSTVTFTHSMRETAWLDGNGYKDNTYADPPEP